MGKFSDSEGAPKKVAELDASEKAIALRCSGATFRAIAAALDVSVSTAHDIVTKAIEARREQRAQRVDELVELELERCDQLQRALAKKVSEGNERAINSTLKVMERRAKLLGLDAAPKLELTGPGGGPLTVNGPRLFVPQLEPESENTPAPTPESTTNDG